MRNYQRHVEAEGGSYKLAVRNIVCHLDMMTDEQKAAINWHAEQSVSLAVMRLISMDDYRAVAKDGEAMTPETTPTSDERKTKELEGRSQDGQP